MRRLPKKDCFRHTKIFLIQNSNFPLCENPASSLPKNVANYPKTRRKPIFFALTKGGCTKKRRPHRTPFFTGLSTLLQVLPEPLNNLISKPGGKLYLSFLKNYPPIFAWALVILSISSFSLEVEGSSEQGSVATSTIDKSQGAQSINEPPLVVSCLIDIPVDWI